MGDNTIDLTFSEDCWFEIRTAQGDLLYADLGRSTTRRYTGAAPFRLKLSSFGVSLIYNDELVDLEPYTPARSRTYFARRTESPGGGRTATIEFAEALSL